MQEDESKSSWVNTLLRCLERPTPAQWKRLLGRLLMTTVVALIVSVVVLYVATRFFGLKIKEGRLNLNRNLQHSYTHAAFNFRAAINSATA